ncbi:SHOCT domain-containing protein [Desulforamulus aeronauticus]|uniref:Putative membrane protein n=1 Tax=Desulforamulus aeronauticus DSM 10349 TaxID=1121421 RepID=A0A1M6X580_9FIRM|nr:SHOCT domain-containing protein [Desulforamulus aeronauticus]SHL01081.1 putative membrane protein [Desulforamulus aeronauticus DSM 10349]
MPMMYGGYGMGWFGGLFMMLIPLALLGLVVYWAVNAGMKNALKTGASSNALDILKSRYARNEITSDEYKRLKEEISH